jgi:hypothetical protein
MRLLQAGLKGRRAVFAACLVVGVLLFRLSSRIYPLETRRLPPGKSAAVVLLRGTANARWVRAGGPLELGTKSSGSTAVFRRRFTLPSPSEPAVLSVRALGGAGAFLDGVSAGGFETGHGPRDAAALFPIPRLGRGEHEIRLEVRDPAGPSLVIAECASLGLATGPLWDAGTDGTRWSAAVPADSEWDVPLSREVGESAPAFLRVLPLLLPLYALAYVLARRSPANPRAVRNLILAALVLLGLNNIRRIPTWIGFDAISHMRYIQAVAADARLPAPDSDWQTFQAPLYYLLSAPLWSFLSGAFGFRLARFFVRVVPVACGVVQAELCYRAARTVYPDRKDLQTVATAAGGLLPMSLYMSQVAGNEPLAGCLSAAVVVAALSARADEAAPRRSRKLAAAGALLGLALLSKVTAFLLVPPLLALVWTRSSGCLREKLSDAGMALGPAAALCGWYFVRNQVQYGRAIFLPTIDASWWQAPGYRTAGQMFSFGRALVRPVYAGAGGFWDSIYSSLWLDGFLSGTADFASRPPWNYAPMLASAWLALAPSALLLAGVAAALVEPARALRSGLLAAAGWLAVFLAAVFYGWLTLPTYSAAKASYLLGLAPCLALLIAGGYDALVRRGLPKAALSAALVCWAVAGYASYFVLSPVVPLARP